VLKAIGLADDEDMLFSRRRPGMPGGSLRGSQARNGKHSRHGKEHEILYDFQRRFSQRTRFFVLRKRIKAVKRKWAPMG
jgi:hypothetical protein